MRRRRLVVNRAALSLCARASPRCSFRWVCQAFRAACSDCHGQRAIGRGSLFVDNVRVPVSHRARPTRTRGRAGHAGLLFFARADRTASACGGPRRSRRDVGVRCPAPGVSASRCRPSRGVFASARGAGYAGRSGAPVMSSASWLKDRGVLHSAEAAMAKGWARSC